MMEFHQKVASEASKLSISLAEKPVLSARHPRIIGQSFGHSLKKS